jgi:hypothetical protein
VYFKKERKKEREEKTPEYSENAIKILRKFQRGRCKSKQYMSLTLHTV